MMRDFLDLDRYPLNRPRSAEWQSLVEKCRDDLARHGMFNLEALVHPHAVKLIAADLSPKFAAESFHHEREHNIYFARDVANLAKDHPALTRFRTANDTLCADQLNGNLLEQLYHWPQFAEFLAAVMGKPALYPMQDSLAGLNAMSYREGQLLNWHFDRSEFTTTMLVQVPQSGGEFLYRTDLRTDDDPNYDGVARLLCGDDPEVRRLALQPGTLNVFRGRNTPHRISPVKGSRPRIVAVFSFYESPGVRFSDEELLGFYGRTR